jgi:5-methyltetrahydrofolate--homocysteine methyltransferase
MKKTEDINLEEAARYLGIKSGNLDDKTKSLLEKCKAELLKFANPKYIYRIFDLNSDFTLAGTNFTLLGDDIKNHLKGCKKVVVMAATLGTGVDKLVKQGSVTDMTDAVIYDALASALIEQVCDSLEKEIKALGFLNLTSRFSSGYGDFPLDTQKDVLKILNAEKLIGLYLTDSSMLIPMKSVTAIMGISDKKTDNKTKSCDSCNMKETCNYRKRGVDCGL